MRHFLLAALIAALAVGCASTGRLVRSFPPLDAKVYDAPDGRRWYTRESRSEGDTVYSLILTPDAAQPKEWKEMLTFGETTRDLSQASVRATFSMIGERLDKNLTYEIEGEEAAFIVIYHSPAWNEKGVQKVVRLKSGYATIYYQERLGEPGDQHLQKWISIIRKTPNQALQTTPITRSEI